MKIVIAGRPGAGKSALFELLARHGGAGAAAEASGRAGLRIAHVEVPDPRVAVLSAAYRPKKTTPARLVFEDLEQKAAPTYPALSPERRDMLAQAGLILLVIGLYSDGPETWEAESIRQWREAMDEFHITDQAVVESRLEKLQKMLRIGQKAGFPGESELLQRLHAHLEAGHPVLTFDCTGEERRNLRGFSLLSGRSVLPAFNISEDHLASAESHRERLLHALAPADPGEASHPCVLFSAEVEKQILELPPEEQASFLQAFGLSSPAVDQVIRAAYALAGLISFFTVGEDEVRAWTTRRGATAPEAAGVIHSDLEKGFVRAEVLHFEDWKALGGEAGAKEKGRWRLEGKEYVVSDGEILHIRSGLAKGGR